jgi:hypothetical protein
MNWRTGSTDAQKETQMIDKRGFFYNLPVRVPWLSIAEPLEILYLQARPLAA